MMPKKQPISELSELDAAVQKAEPIIKHAIAEYRKEVERLQKQLVKEQIAHESETARRNEQFEKDKITVQIQKFAPDKDTQITNVFAEASEQLKKAKALRSAKSE